MIAETLEMPQSYKDAIESENSNEWQDAMKDEYSSPIKNRTWVLVDRNQCNRNPLRCRWLYKTKLNSDSKIDRFKARLMVFGCSQKAGVDYSETFAPVTRFETIRTVLAIVASRDLMLRQFDIKTAFLNGDLEDRIFMSQPEGFSDGTNRVCLLKKSLYGLKQAPRAWNETFDKFLRRFGLEQSASDQCMYTGKDVIFVLYVDDGLVATESVGAISKLLLEIKKCFEVKHSDVDHYFGLQIDRNRSEKTIKVHQKVYVNNLLKKFNMEDCNPCKTPAESGLSFNFNENKRTDVPYRQLIGGLMFLAIVTRSDISFIVAKLSKFLEKPSNEHWLE